ncbi:MAG: putative lipopolysaccharide heptosyltransferase III [bacterium]
MINEISLRKIKKILIIKLRKIGDVLLTTPTIKAFRVQFPQAHIAALVNSGTEEVLTDNPLLDEVIVFDRNWKSLPFLTKIKRQCRFVLDIRKKDFDLVLDLTGGDRPAIISFLSGAKYRVVHDPGKSGFFGKRWLYNHLVKSMDSQRKHMVEYNLDAVRYLGIAPKDKKVDIFVPPSIQVKVDSLLSSKVDIAKDLLVQVHPTSDWLFKCWRDEYVAEIIDYFSAQYGAKIIITSSPAQKELDKIENILRYVRTKDIICLAGKTTLKELAAVSRRCKLFFGVDTAAMHIAAATGTTSIVLFGPSGEFHWGPWGEDHIVITSDPACRPCGKDGCNGSKYSKCLDIITPERVRAAIDEKIETEYF